MGFDAQHALLVLALIATNVTDKKEFKKRAIKVSKKCDPLVAAGIMNDIINSPTPRQAVFDHLDGRDNLAEVTAQLRAERFPGMVVYKGEAYGVQIEVPNAETRFELDPSKTIAEHKLAIATDGKWAMANEDEMTVAFAHAVMNHLNLNRLKAKVLLFKEAGFSGVIVEREIERGAMRHFDVKVNKSSNYHVTPITIPVLTDSSEGLSVKETVFVSKR
jgi:hypothetical protein